MLEGRPPPEEEDTTTMGEDTVDTMGGTSVELDMEGLITEVCGAPEELAMEGLMIVVGAATLLPILTRGVMVLMLARTFASKSLLVLILPVRDVDLK